MEILVSVIIPTKNRAALLKRAIQSVRAQTLQSIEIIVIDDASTDETPQILKYFPDIIVITNIYSLGGSESRNKGIMKSSGKWIAFLDDDDMWRPEKLERQISFLEKEKDAIACITGYQVNYPMGYKRLVMPPEKITLSTLLRNNHLGGSSVCLCLASVLKELGGFDAHLQSAQDWDLWVKLLLKGKIISLRQILVNYFVHFEYRISNNMRGKYLGARRFYFKYRRLMDQTARIQNLAFICYIKSRQTHHRTSTRIRYLQIARRYSEKTVKNRYLLSSLPRIIFNLFC